LCFRPPERELQPEIRVGTGLLFPGCIYAWAGHVEEARKFVTECKEFLKGDNKIEGFWYRFVDFVNVYPFDNAKEFQLLLSVRCSGQPRFYLISSKQPSLLVQNNSIVTLGSGKEMLDGVIMGEFSKRTQMVDDAMKHVDNAIRPHRVHPATFPYFYCLWLNEIALGMQLSKLEEHDVGGIFHFLWQDSSGEHAQEPSVYLLSAADLKTRTVYHWLYRVAYADGCLVVENPIVGFVEVFADTSTRPELVSMTAAELDEFREKMVNKANSQPFYYFFGLGFADPKDRNEFLVNITTAGDYVVSRQG